mmetsp:Transcript_14365/g.34543  ORF Transcript_14365/g.34543 Transcript_14365/m.34543 type:complete len:255 (+) Transcript_14365:178-942(+)
MAELLAVTARVCVVERVADGVSELGSPSFSLTSKLERLGGGAVVVREHVAHLAHRDVGEQSERAEEHAAEDARHDGEVRDAQLRRVDHEEARGPQVEHDEVRPAGQHGAGVGEHARHRLDVPKRRGVHGKCSLGEEEEGEGDVEDGVGYGDGERNCFGVTPLGEEHQGEPRGDAAPVARVQDLVVGEGQERDGAGARGGAHQRRAFRLGRREGRARKREGESRNTNTDGDRYGELLVRLLVWRGDGPRRRRVHK